MNNQLFKNSYRNYNFFVSISRRYQSSYNRNSNTGVASLVSKKTADDLNIWSENNWSLYAKQFNKSADFPLPGCIGLALQTKMKVNETEYAAKSDECKKRATHLAVNELLSKPLPEEKKAEALRQAAHYRDNYDKNGEYSTEPALDIKQALELEAFPCPRSLYNDFQMYFPKMSQDSINVITISFKTENDMATWNSDVESERETVITNFVNVAQDLCTIFKKEGFWADFIDPSCGRPHHAHFGHATLYETDERYRHFGFEILDQGCCKVISHHKWGTKCYVGCFVTNAPINSDLTKSVIDKFNNRSNQ
jgi:hypothetical protein